ncbi:RNA helicase [Bacillus aerolatus]|uniref:RNA helicase n=1 Tax=Bacillus aerolatus TaxID=2653354 RepID=A0A6I1FIJ5_9BACI|nr:helicase-related protein [Bacillus aerolatus]KAB7706168.1 RNA helicase [Bacillus aerolatus]
MKKITDTHIKAISHTKQKIHEDIIRFLETKEKLPSFAQYLEDRGEYTKQIWLNVWINKASNEIPSKEKRAFLRERGFVTKDVARKLINQLFRNEIRDHQPFDPNEWLNQKYGQQMETWQVCYEQARAQFFARQEEQRREKEQTVLHDKIEAEAEKIVEQNEERLYLPFRHSMAIRLHEDLQTKKRFYQVDTAALEEQLTEAGSFDPRDYETVGDFFGELTGHIEQTWHWEFEYETYYSVYEQLAANYAFDLILQMIFDNLSEQIKNDYKEANSEVLTTDILMDMIDHLLSDTEWKCFVELEEEALADLLHIASLPFDEAVHKSLYEKGKAEREQKKAQEQAELERRKAEEERLIEEIFGQAYRPPAERSVRYVLHIGETNTGKTHQALERMKQAKSGLYLAPLRLLALEVYEKLNKEGIPCSLKTGEEEKATQAACHASCTVEMFHEKDFYEVVVIDEAQMIADKDRGFSWYKAITGARADEVHIIASKNMKEMLIQLLGDSEYELIEYSRDIPLQVEPAPFKLFETAKGDALVCFSRREVLETAARLKKNRFSVSMIYGSMPPETRKKQMQQFIEGKTSVIVSTDAIGMGLNLPIRRIVFLKNEKFDGSRRRLLTSQEVKQIAGRAGRKGLYSVGKVAFTSDIKTMTYLLETEDKAVTTFAIAPTTAVFERFQRHYRDLGTFFELWHRFKSPKGTKKSSLSQERALYEFIRGSEIEARLSMTDLYGFLHLPFSTKEPEMTRQWLATMQAVVSSTDLPEPQVKTGTLEDLELSYKAIGLHLLFLYRLERQTEAIYWERLRETISEGVHEQLQSEETRTGKTCKSCRKKLPSDFRYQLCDSCHASRREKKYYRNKRY